LTIKIVKYRLLSIFKRVLYQHKEIIKTIPLNNMTRIYALICLLIIGLGAKAQMQNNRVSLADASFNKYFFQNHTPHVHGKIINATKDELAGLNITYTLVTPFSNLQSSRVAAINSDGSFDLSLDYPFPYQQIWFDLKDYFYAGLYANKDLNLELDFAKLKQGRVDFVGNGVTYSGTDGAMNLWMNKQICFKTPVRIDIDRRVHLLNPHDADYFKQLSALFAEQKALNDEFIHLNPSSYAWMPENERLSEYYGDVLSAAISLKKEPADWENIKLHKSYLVSNSGSIFNTHLYEYFRYVKSNINFRNYHVQDETHKLDSVFGQPYADVLKLKMHDENIQVYNQMLAELLPTIKTPWCKTVLEKEYKVTTERLRQVNHILRESKPLDTDSVLGEPMGQLSFGAKLSTVSNMEPEEFLHKLKNKFNGKAIILDFWATWCVPCLIEMPYSHKLHDQATDLPVEFVYICTSQGSNIDVWKTKIAELKQPGIHLFIDEILVKKIMTMFDKSGFPSYVCLDQSGQVQTGVISRMSIARLDDIKKLTGNK
jgi:thiol-disulfide isomerase/thioredoxin